MTMTMTICFRNYREIIIIDIDETVFLCKLLVAFSDSLKLLRKFKNDL